MGILSALRRALGADEPAKSRGDPRPTVADHAPRRADLCGIIIGEAAVRPTSLGPMRRYRLTFYLPNGDPFCSSVVSAFEIEYDSLPGGMLEDHETGAIYTTLRAGWEVVE